MFPRALLGAGERLLGQISQHAARELLMHAHGHRIACEFVSVNQPAGEFVVGVGRQAIINKKFRFGIKRCGIAFHQALHLRTRLLRACDGIGTRQRGNILSKTVTGNKSMKIVPIQAKAGQVIPAPHVLAGSSLSGRLAKDFQQAIIV